MFDAVLDFPDCLGETGAVAPGASSRQHSMAKVNADRALFDVIARDLRNTGYPALRGLEIEIEGGVVVTWGRAPNSPRKRLSRHTETAGLSTESRFSVAVTANMCETTLEDRTN